MTWVRWRIPFVRGADLAVARDLIERSRKAGFQVLLSITGNKEDLANGGGDYLDAFADFLGNAAALGADAVEVWREMNIDREWPAGQIDPAAYALMLQKAFAAIKAANPDTLVITGALWPTGAEHAFGPTRVWNDDHYYAGMAEAGAADYVDCIGLRYTDGMLSPDSRMGDPRVSYPILGNDVATRGLALPQRRYPHVHDRVRLSFAGGLRPASGGIRLGRRDFGRRAGRVAF